MHDHRVQISTEQTIRVRRTLGPLMACQRASGTPVIAPIPIRTKSPVEVEGARR